MNKTRRFLAVLLTFCMIFTTQTATLWASVIPQEETELTDETPSVEVEGLAGEQEEQSVQLYEEPLSEEKVVGSQNLTDLVSSITVTPKEGQDTTNLDRNDTFSVSVAYEIGNGDQLAAAKLDPSWTYDLSSLVGDSGIMSPVNGKTGDIIQFGTIRGTYTISNNIVTLNIDPTWLNQQQLDVSGTFDLELQFDADKVNEAGSYDITFPDGSIVPVTFKDVEMTAKKTVGYNEITDGSNVNVVGTAKADGTYRLHYETSVAPTASLTSLVLEDEMAGGQTLEAGTVRLGADLIPSDYVAVSSDGTTITIDIVAYLASKGQSVEINKEYKVSYDAVIDENDLDVTQTNTANWTWKGGTETAKTAVTPYVTKDYNSYLSKEMSVEGNGAGALIKYTVKIGQNGENLAGLTITDTMEDVQEIVGDITVNPAIEGLTITAENRASFSDAVHSTNYNTVFTYKFPSDGTYTGPYEITYYTKIPEYTGNVEGEHNVGNKISITDDDDGSGSVEVKKPIELPGPPIKLSKEIGAWDTDNNSVNWTINVDIPDGKTINNVTINEILTKFGEDLDNLLDTGEVVWDQIKVTDSEGEPVTDYTPNKSNNSITFASLSKDVIITLQTTPTDRNNLIPEHDVYWAKNKVEGYVDNVKITEVEAYGRFVTENLKMNKDVSYDKENKVWTWTVTVNPNNDIFEADYVPFFSDTLPDGMEIADSIVDLKCAGNGNLNSRGQMVYGRTGSVTVEVGSIVIDPINLVDALYDQYNNSPTGINGMKYTISYKTRLSEAGKESIKGHTTADTFTNIAKIVDDNNTLKGSVEKSTEYSYEFIEKYDTSKTNLDDDIIEYKIIVNPDALTLNDDTPLVVTDVLSKDVELITNGVKVLNKAGQAISSAKVGYYDDTRTLEITVPDSTYVEITFLVTTVDLNDRRKPDDKSTFSNSVTVQGKNAYSAETSKEHRAIQHSATIVGQKNAIALHKVVQYGLGTDLPGAKFSLYRCTLDSNYVIESRELVGTKGGYVSNGSGAVLFTGLTPNTLYYWVEESAPDGYEITATLPHYFIMYSANTNKAIEKQNEAAARIIDTGAQNNNTFEDGSPIIVNLVKDQYVWLVTNLKSTNVTASFEGTKTFTGTSTDGNEVSANFTFTLTPGDTSYPMPEASDSVTIDESTKVASVTVPVVMNGDAATFSFGSIKYDSEGVYTYTIAETKGTDTENIQYDTNTFTVKVDVSRDEKTGELTKTVTVNDSPDTKIAFANSAIEKTSATVVKVWEDNNNQDGVRPESLTVTLTKNGEKTDQTVTLTADKNWTDTISNLPAKENGKAITYGWSEPEITGYTAADPTVEGTTTTLTNTHTTETTSATVVKVWSDNNNQDGLRPESLTVTLTKNGEKTDQTVTLTADKNWTDTISNLPAKENGTAITYGWSEPEITGYTAETPAVDGTTTTLTNTHTTETTSATVVKVWSDNNNQDGVRPESLTVTLTKNGEKTDQTVTLTADKNWTDTISNLPAKENGKAITYGWSEPAVTGYTAADPVVEGTTTTLTNTHTTETTSAKVIKVWDDSENQDGIRPGELVVNLLKNNEETGQSVTLTEEKQWADELTNLPKYENGQLIVYSWSEVLTTAGYSLSNSVVNGTTTTLTNKYAPGMTSATVVKVWSDNNDQDGLRPESLVFTLTKNGTPVEGKTVTLSDANNWTDTISDLPEKEDGTAITYGWSEPEVTGYTADRVVNGTITTFTNTHTTETTSATVVKVWDDNNNQDGARPESLVFTLTKNGTPVEGKTVTLSDANNWTDTISDLPAKESGKAVTYGWTEPEVIGYTTSAPVVSGTTTTFTNTHTTDTTSAKVVKAWNDKNNQDGIRPESLVVTLTKNGEKTDKTFTLDEKNNWSAEATGLAVNENGSAIKYGWVEEDVEGYTLTDTTTAGTVTTMTNTHTVDTVSASVVKVWDDNDNKAGLRPANLTVILTRNGVETEQSVTLNEGNNWKDGITGLPKNENGKEITYGWKEGTMPGGYSLANTSAVGTVTTLTNTYSAGATSVTFAGTKTFNGYPAGTTAPKFEYVLEETTSGSTYKDTANTEGAGNYSFNTITYTEAGNHSYKVYENNTGISGVGYDTTEYKIAVKVADDGTGKLKADVTISGDTAPTALNFTNTYSTIKISKVEVNGSKELEGATIQILDENNEVVVIDGNRLEWESGTEAHEVAGLKAGVVYTLRETVAPEGYAVASDTTFVLKEDGTIDESKTKTKVKDGVLLVEDKKTSVKISKVEVNGSKELEGATIQILDEKGNVVVIGTEKLEWTSGTETKVIEGLKTGVTYTLKETVAPDGYAIASETTFALDAEGNIDNTKTTTKVEGDVLLVEDEKTSVKISKVEVNGSEELKGATIQILNEKDEVVEINGKKLEWVSGTEAKVIEGLKTGVTYKLKETVAPAGYAVASVTTFALDAEGNIDKSKTSTKVTDGVLLVEDAKTSVKISKVDITDSKEVENATIQILDKNGKVVEIGGEKLEWVSGKEAKVVEGLKTGEVYTLKETIAPEGYTIATETTFALTADGKIDETQTTTKVADGVLLVEDSKTSVTISKVDIADSEELEGATIQILDKDGKVVELNGEKLEWKSEKTGKTIKGLKTDVEYTLHEEVAPEGYTVATDTTFVIGTDGKVTFTGSVSTDGKLLVEDSTTSIKISKVDIADSKEVPGAELQILDKNGKVVVINGKKLEWTSGTEATEIKGLKTGETYTLVEKVAPEGYAIGTIITFNIGDTGTIVTTGTMTEDGVLLVEDAKTSVKISKVEIGGSEELEGATIQILDKDGKIVEINGEKLEWVSGTEAKEIIGLTTGETYTLKETVAPTGYGIATETTFVLKEDGTIDTEKTTTTIKDGVLLVEDDTIDFTFNKVAAGGGEEVEGAEIEVYEVDAEGKETLIDSWTSKAGETRDIGSKLKSNTEYVLRETVAPAGYGKITTDIKVKVAEDGKITTELKQDENGVYLVEDDAIVFTFNKVAAGGGEEVEGAAIEVYEVGAEGKETLIDSWTSKAGETRDIGSKLKSNTEYVLRETVAPAGYGKITTDIKVKVAEDGKITTDLKQDENGVYLVEDDAIVFTFNKVAAGGGEEVEGAAIEVYEVNAEGKETLIDSWTSKKGETRDIGDKLKSGTKYVLRETVAPEGYARITTDISIDVADDGTITTELKKNDEGVYLVEDSLTKVKISKVEIGGSEELEGATIQILNKDGSVVELNGEKLEWVSGKEAHVVEGLKTGVTYILKETVAPEGYAVTSETTFALKDDGTINAEATSTTLSEEGVLLVEDSKTSVKISKVEIGGSEELEGATIQILDKDGKVVEIDGQKLEWVSGKEAKTVEGLKTGEIYTLRETVAPDGYTIASDTTFALNADGTIDEAKTSTKVTDGVLLVEDTMTSVTISKVDIADSKEVKGATLKILDQDGKVVEINGEKLEWTSDTTGKTIKGLKTGVEYTLHEEVAPDGYTIATDTTFVIDTEGKVTYTGTVDADGKLLVEDSMTSVKVSKVDVADSKEVEGAILKILDKDGTEVQKWVSGTEAKEIKGLKTGETYTLIEKVAPDGYAITTETTFIINTNGTIVSSGSISEDGVLLVEDSKTSVKISKVEIGGSEELEGATIQILDKNGNVVEINGEKLEWVSGTEARTVEGLKTGETYTLKETVAPTGYGITAETTFALKEDGTIDTEKTTTTVKDGVLLVEDDAIDFTFNKVAAGSGAEVEGATIEVYEVAADGTETMIDSWTSKAGETHDIGGMLKNNTNYIMRETVAPAGYGKITTDIKVKVAEDGTVTTDLTKNTDGVYLVEDNVISFVVNKVAAGTGEELDGAKLTVYEKTTDGKVKAGSDGKALIIDTWTSKKGETHDFGSKLEAGKTYYLVETVAPTGYNVMTTVEVQVAEDGTITTSLKSSKAEDGTVVYLVQDTLKATPTPTVTPKAATVTPRAATITPRAKVTTSATRSTTKTTTSTTAKTTAARTGDNSPIAMYVILILVAGAAIVMVVKRSKKAGK